MPASRDDTGTGAVERDCVCLMRATGQPHIAECNQKFRAKFFRMWRRRRAVFYGL